MRVSKMSGALLDYWVARAEGRNPAAVSGLGRVCFALDHGTGFEVPRYSTDWVQGGPIIERERLIIQAGNSDWAAVDTNPENGFIYEINEIARFGMTGPTPLIAAMRAYVATKFGDEVDEGSDACRPAT